MSVQGESALRGFRRKPGVTRVLGVPGAGGSVADLRVIGGRFGIESTLVGGEFTAIAAITDYCSAVGLLRDETRYDTALAWLDKLDQRAMTQLGQPFVGFAASAARAFICWPRRRA